MTPARAPSAAAPPGAVSALDGALALDPALRVLDVRDAAAFARGHLAGAGHVALEDLGARRMELPSRAVPLLAVDDEPARARAAAHELAARGYLHVRWLERPLAHEAAGHASRAPAARLWSPGEFLARVLPRCPAGRALDLACGSGRAAVHLALAGWSVEAWDVDETALAMARSFAARLGARIATRRVDLEADAPPALEATGALWDLVVVTRYLHRPLFPWIERALAPGGALVYETFRRGQERFGHPRRPRHLLAPGELARAFPSLVVEEYEETPADRPPVLARLFARRPAGSRSAPAS